MQEHGGGEEEVCDELPNAQADQGLSVKRLTNVRCNEGGQPPIVMPRLLDSFVSVVLVEG